MISVQPGTFSSLDRRCSPDVRPLVPDPAENTMAKPPFNRAESLKNGQSIEQSTWCLSQSQKELCCSPLDPSPVSHIRVIDPPHGEAPSPNQTDSTPADRRPGLPLRRSSGSLASSIQTVIHISSSTAVDPTSTCRMAHGSFVESESGSSQLLSEVSAKSYGEHGRNNSDTQGGSDIHANSKSNKIQFHDVVRIAGGISSHPKRKRATKQTPRRISAPRESRITPEQQKPGSSSRSPMQYSGFVEGLPNYPGRNISNSDSSDILAGYTQARRLYARDSSSSPIGRSFSNSRSRQNSLRPGPPSTRSSFSYGSRSDSVSPSKLNNINSHPAGLSLSKSHTLSTSSSFTQSGHFPATITSRSSSTASSLYLPLRIPVVRAPAPFFGPTPERVARVRERRQVAQRDAERAKGGWKAWWNNWYHQSDKLATRKGKAKQDPSSHQHQDFNSNPREDSDSDDGSCYHDVILEHERKKLERKLKKLQQIRINAHDITNTAHTTNSSTPKTCQHHHKKMKLNPEKTHDRQSWLSWISSFAIGLPPPPPMHPLKLPTSGSGISGILKAPPGMTSPGRPVSPLMSKQSCISPLGPTPKSLATVQEIDSRTPLLAAPQVIPQYNPTDHTDFHSHLHTPVQNHCQKNWLSFVWWQEKIQQICYSFVHFIASKFHNLFHIDWDSRYDEWENV